MWIAFDRDFAWFPGRWGRAFHVCFAAGSVVLTTHPAAAAAIAAGAGRPARPPEIEEARNARRRIA